MDIEELKELLDSYQFRNWSLFLFSQNKKDFKVYKANVREDDMFAIVQRAIGYYKSECIKKCKHSGKCVSPLDMLVNVFLPWICFSLNKSKATLLL